jgi:dynactin complex subunit
MTERLPGGTTIQRRDPVTSHEVEEAVARLKQKGLLPSRRNVRAELGGGSLSKIHRLVSEYEAAHAPKLPDYSLSTQEATSFVEFGRAAFGFLHEKLNEKVAHREAILLNRAETAELALQETIRDAEAIVQEAARKVAEADGAKNVAIAAATDARREADLAIAEAQRLRGQMDVLLTDRDQAVAKLAVAEESLTLAEARVAFETEARQQSEAREQTMEIQSKTIRDALGSAERALTEVTAKSSGELKALQARLSEMTKARDEAMGSIGGFQTQLSRAEVKIAVLQHDTAEKDGLIRRFREELSEVTAQNRTLIEALTKFEKHDASLASLREMINSSTAVADGGARKHTPRPALKRSGP